MEKGDIYFVLIHINIRPYNGICKVPFVFKINVILIKVSITFSKISEKWNNVQNTLYGEFIIRFQQHFSTTLLL